MRGTIWGVIVGASLAVAGGHAVAYWNNEWPFYRNKVAAHTAIDVTRTIGAPSGAIIGGVVGALVHSTRSKLRHQQS